MSERSYIAFRNVDIGFGGGTVLQNFSFEISKGEHIVLKGESGSGKSTILKLLLRFLNPDAGEIIFESGRSPLQAIRRCTAWLPQDLNLGPGSVEEVIRRPFSFDANRSRSVSRKRIGKTLERLGVSAENLDKPYRDLSTGQRQRVGLALCHLLAKPVLLLDEPTSALDYLSKEKAAELMLDTDRTIVSTSHDTFWVELADKVIELD